MQDTDISREQASAQAQDVGPPLFAPQQPQVKRINRKNITRTKWVFKNKEDEHGVVVCNKARLVAKGFSHVEGGLW